jgi:hypothetical protein
MEFNLGSRFCNNPANAFNKYYLNIIDEVRIQSNIESTKFSLKGAFPQGFPEIINIPITELEVKCTIKVLKNKNSSGYNGICTKIIKAGCDHINIPLAYILNMSLTQGRVPDQLK